jgi:hypothetical protein
MKSSFYNKEERRMGIRRVSTLIVVILGVSVLGGSWRGTTAFAANSCDTSGGGAFGEVTTRVSANGVTTQFLTGDAARAYMNEVYKKNPLRAAAHAKGQKLLADMGYQPSDKIYVVRNFAPPRAPVRTTLVTFRLTPAQLYDYNNGTEDFTWDSVDTGDNSTWTGLFSYANNASNVWGDWSANHDLSSMSTVWSQVNWSYLNGDSAGGCCHYIRNDESPRAHGSIRAVSDHYPDVWYGKESPRPHPVGWRGNYRAFYGCATFWCGGTAIGAALFAGPTAPAVFAGGCTAALVGCSYDTLFY